MAELTDEEAISQAETFLNHFRAARRLEELVRYIKNARKDFPELQMKLNTLTKEIAEAQRRASVEQNRLAALKAEIEPKIAEFSARHKSVSDAVTTTERQLASLRGQAASLEAATRDQQARLDTLTTSVSTLTEEEKVLRVKIADHETRLAELRQSAAKLLEG